MDQQKTGAFICLLRKERGFTQRELADRLNVTDKAVSKWERGQSYPDITILTALAESLGATERELLMGEREGENAAEPPTELVVRDTLEYAEKAAKQRTGRAAAIVMGIYGGALLLSVFICGLCDVILNKGFTWSLVVLAACVLAWGVVAPFYYCKRRRILCMTVAVSVLVPVLLWVTAQVDPLGAMWFPQPALLLAGIWLGLLWVVALLHTFTPMNKWYIAAIAIFLSAPLNWATNAITNDWINTGIDPISVFTTVASGVLVVIIGIAVGRYGRKRATARVAPTEG